MASGVRSSCGEINHELLLLLQRLLLRTEVSEADQQKGRPHQLDRLPLHLLNGLRLPSGRRSR